MLPVVNAGKQAGRVWWQVQDCHGLLTKRWCFELKWQTNFNENLTVPKDLHLLKN